MLNYTFNLISFEIFLLILVRIASFVYVAPFYGMPNTPGRVKIGFSFVVSLLIYQVIAPTTEFAYAGVFAYSILVIKESLTGLFIGFAASICNTIILTSGKLIDMNIGLSMATEYDPMTKTQASVVANFYNYFITLLLLVSYMHHYILRAVIDSFQLIPLGGANFRWDHLLVAISRFMTDSFIIAFRIFLPIFGVMLLVNCILGILAKVAPQMNMFAVGMQFKLLVGLFVMFFTIFLLPDIANFVYKEIRIMVTLIIEGMY